MNNVGWGKVPPDTGALSNLRMIARAGEFGPNWWEHGGDNDYQCTLCGGGNFGSDMNEHGLAHYNALPAELRSYLALADIQEGQEYPADFKKMCAALEFAKDGVMYGPLRKRVP